MCEAPGEARDTPVVVRLWAVTPAVAIALVAASALGWQVDSIGPG
jgi:hypothetical protein